MKCILLCAGYATRLFPLTENFPKMLLDIGGRPLLDYTVDQVNTIDEIDEIYAVTNNRYAKHIEEWAKSKNNVKPITVINDGSNSNDDRLGAIGDIKYTIDKMKIDDDLVIIAGDNLFTFDLRDAIDYSKEKNAPVVCVKASDDIELLRRVGIAEVDETGRIIGFEEKPQNPKSNLCTYAEYIYPKEVVKYFDEYIEQGNPIDAPGNFVAWLYKKTDTYAFEFDGECYDVGTHESLKEVSELYRRKNEEK
ncbi:MAG: nucleotidyltransferase family protein [Clostridia bacterium]|nr:nucleotidyltransferase family protein [Clostridia bacterium]MDD4375939.1 nucleotidyltransferase family protein [Clostridia bacterium]